MTEAVSHSPSYAAPAAACAAELLSVLAREGVALGLTELARETGRSKSLAYRVLHELEETELVEKLDNGKYKLGIAALLLGGSYVSGPHFRGFVDRELRRLAEETGDMAYLAMLDGDGVRIQAGHEGKSVIAAASLVGQLIPANCSAAGKALLARLPRRVMRRLVGGEQRGLTSRSIVDTEELLKELEAVREAGYAREEGETHPSLAGIAYAIHARQPTSGTPALRMPNPIIGSGHDLLAIGISMNIERSDTHRELVHLALLQTASRVERETRLLESFGTAMSS